MRLLFLSVLGFCVILTTGGEVVAADAQGRWADYVAASFSGGKGTPDDPYRIATPGQLALMARNVNAGIGGKAHYLLIDSIDLGGDDLAREWTPIGTLEGRPFTGFFDGGGYVVSGMRIFERDMQCAGLFGFVSRPGEIRNVGVTDVRIDIEMPWSWQKSNVGTGGLVGFFAGDRIDRSYVTGRVKGSGHVGGLVGIFWKGGVISNTYAAAEVICTPTNRSADAGGLVGFACEVMGIAGSFAAGSVTVSSQVGTMYRAIAGGLVGNVLYRCEIADSYATADVFAAYLSADKVEVSLNAGGLVGYCSSGSIHNAFATGNAVSFSRIAVPNFHAACGFAGGVQEVNVRNVYARGGAEAYARYSKETVFAGVFGGMGQKNAIFSSYADGPVSADEEGQRQEGLWVCFGPDDSDAVSGDADVSIGGRQAMQAVDVGASDLRVENVGFLVARGWDFERDWCHSVLDGGARPHLRAFFDARSAPDFDVFSPDMVALAPATVMLRPGETKHVRLIACGWERSADIFFDAPSPVGIKLTPHPVSRDFFTVTTNGDLLDMQADVSVDFRVAGRRQPGKPLRILVRQADGAVREGAACYRNTDIRAFRFSSNGISLDAVPEKDGRTLSLWVSQGTDLSAWEPEILLWPGATLSPPGPFDLRAGSRDVSVIAADGKTRKEWTLAVRTMRLSPFPERAHAELTPIEGVGYLLEVQIPFEPTVTIPHKLMDSFFFDIQTRGLPKEHWNLIAPSGASHRLFRIAGKDLYAVQALRMRFIIQDLAILQEAQILSFAIHTADSDNEGALWYRQELEGFFIRNLLNDDPVSEGEK
jgi:hypothetical protein